MYKTPEFSYDQMCTIGHALKLASVTYRSDARESGNVRIEQQFIIQAERAEELLRTVEEAVGTDF